VGRKQTEHRPHVVTVLVHPYIPPRRRTLRRPAGNSADLTAASTQNLLSPDTATSANALRPFLRTSYFGTTMDTCFIAVPPRRFEPMIEIVCWPGASCSVKCRKLPSGAMFGTDWPFTIKAAPGSVLPTISAECPTTCVLVISRTISCDLPWATSVNLKISLTSLVCFFPSVAVTFQKYSPGSNPVIPTAVP